MKNRLLPVLLVVPLLAATAQAGITSLWHKDAKPTPAERVPQLLITLRTDGDEGKRSAAAEELRQYDPAAFPEIIPALLNALQNDSKPSVRSEAAQSLGHFRPVTQQIGEALEAARDKDASMRVRLQARRELLTYRWHGNYHSDKPEQSQGPTTKEPPLAPPLPDVRPVQSPSAYPPSSTPPAVMTTPAPPVQRPVSTVPAPAEPARPTGPALPPPN
jgi:uncharacterized membrane protein